MGTPFSAIALASGRYVSAPHHARIDFVDDAFTVNCRYKGSAAGPIANKYDSATSKGWKIESVSGGNVKFTINGTAVSAGSVLDGAYHDIECSHDINRDRLLLWVDGALAAPVAFTVASLSNTAAFQVGRAPDGSSTLTGSIAEVRLSRGLRHEADFTPPYTQFEDDGQTRLLWHFNEGKGATIFDMSADAIDEFDYGTRQNGAVGGSASGTWDYGPLMANPARILHEGMWYALDVDTALQAYGNAVKLKRHRARVGDKATNRILAGKAIWGTDFPGIFTFPQTVPGIPPETNAYDACEVPLTFMGGVVNQGAFGASDLWWLVYRAALRQEITDAGHFFHTRVQNWVTRRTVLNTTPMDDGGIASSFVCQVDFEVNCDLRSTGTP